MAIPIVPLPFATDHPQRKVPYVTLAICAINILVFACIWDYRITNFSHLNPDFLDPWLYHVDHPSLVTLFTHAFIHVDPFHLLGNLLIFWLVGRVLEEGLGSPLFVLVYIASLVMATMLHTMVVRVFLPDVQNIPMLGASGAISGVMGLAVFRFYRLRVKTLPLLSLCCLPIPIPVVFWLPFWFYAVFFAVNEIYSGITQISNVQYGAYNINVPRDNVAHWTHIGGLLLGVLAAFLLDSIREGKRGYALADAEKAVHEGIPANATLQQLEQLLRERPDDPEVLEAMAALALAHGDSTNSRQLRQRLIAMLLKNRELPRAARSYLAMRATFPDAVLSASEQLAMASALESTGHYQDAADAFQLVLNSYPQSREAETALLRGAHVYQRHLHDVTTAKWMLQALLEQYPSSPWETLARARLRDVEKSMGER